MAVSVDLSSAVIAVVTATDVGGNTMLEVANAIIAIDATRCTVVGTVITIKIKAGQTYCAMTLNNGTKITMNAGYTLEFESETGATVRTVFTVNTEAEFIIESNAILDFSSTATMLAANGYAYIYFYGKVTAVASLGNEIILKHYRICWIYPINTQTWQYVKFMDIHSYTTTTSQALNLNGTGTSNVTETGIPATITMKNITIINTLRPYYGYGFQTSANGTIMDNYILEDWWIEKIYSGFRLDNTGSLKLKNFTVYDSASYSGSGSGGAGVGSNYPYNPSNYNPTNGNNLQTAIYFDNCVFDTVSGGSYNMLWYYRCFIVYKDCTFLDGGATSTYGVYTNYIPTICFIGNNTTNNSYLVSVIDTNTLCFHVRDIDITVKDIYGDPIENAIVSITHSSDFEHWSSHTNSLGKLKTCNAENIKLVEKEQINSAGTMIEVSNSKDEYYGKGDGVTNYIDSGIASNTITDFEISFRYNEPSASETLWGNVDSADYFVGILTPTEVYIYVSGGSTLGGNLIAYFTEDNNYTITLTKTDATHFDVIIYNDTTSTEMYNQNFLIPGTQPTQNCYLFARNVSGTSIIQYSTLKGYYFKINSETWTLNQTSGATVTGDLGTVLPISGGSSGFWGNQYHIITVTKSGYSAEVQEIEVTEDKVLNFVLTPLTDYGTNIKGSTLYGATIY